MGKLDSSLEVLTQGSFPLSPLSLAVWEPVTDMIFLDLPEILNVFKGEKFRFDEFEEFLFFITLHENLQRNSIPSNMGWKIIEFGRANDLALLFNWERKEKVSVLTDILVNDIARIRILEECRPFVEAITHLLIEYSSQPWMPQKPYKELKGKFFDKKTEEVFQELEWLYKKSNSWGAVYEFIYFDLFHPHPFNYTSYDFVHTVPQGIRLQDNFRSSMDKIKMRHKKLPLWKRQETKRLQRLFERSKYAVFARYTPVVQKLLAFIRSVKARDNTLEFPVVKPPLKVSSPPSWTSKSWREIIKMTYDILSNYTAKYARNWCMIDDRGFIFLDDFSARERDICNRRIGIIILTSLLRQSLDLGCFSRKGKIKCPFEKNCDQPEMCQNCAFNYLIANAEKLKNILQQCTEIEWLKSLWKNLHIKSNLK